MKNPWLHIPKDDYIGHMASPIVGQRPVLARLFGESLAAVRPNSLLVLGCSTGNGFEHIDPLVTSHVVAVDVNPGYLHHLRENFSMPPFNLDLRCGDLNEMEFERNAYDMVHAALLFDYIDWMKALPRVAKALRPGAVLSAVVQIPSTSSPSVSATPFVSLKRLEALFHFVDPTTLTQAARRERLELDTRRIETLPGGKAFEVLRFINNAV